MRAAICLWPRTSAGWAPSGGVPVQRPSTAHAAVTALAKALGSRAFQAAKQRATAFP